MLVPKTRNARFGKRIRFEHASLRYNRDTGREAHKAARWKWMSGTPERSLGCGIDLRVINIYAVIEAMGVNEVVQEEGVDREQSQGAE